MQLTQHHKSTNSSLSHMKNNLENTNIRDIANYNQFKSAIRLNAKGKDQTSKEIIEKFTEGLNREVQNNRLLKKNTINLKTYNMQNLSKKNQSSKINANIKINKNFNNNIQIRKNSNIKSTKSNVIFKNESIIDLKGKRINQKLLKTNTELIIQSPESKKDEIKNKKNKYLNNNFKKSMEIEEAGHNKIVHSINQELKKQNFKNESENSKNLIELKKVKKNSKKELIINDLKLSDSIQNNNIEINYNQNNDQFSESDNFNKDFKNTLLHLIEHFNTKIKGEITGNHYGKFEIKTNSCLFSIKIKKENNQLTIIINSKSINQLLDQIKKIECSLLEKMPELNSVNILTNYKISNIENNQNNLNNKQINNVPINQNSFFKLNYLA